MERKVVPTLILSRLLALGSKIVRVPSKARCFDFPDIPMEIWQQVFYVLVVTATSAYERAVIRGTLSSVCRQWRLGVLNCPELWTVLPPIDLRLKAPERSITEEFSIAKHIHDQVQWHLECSGSLPIDFSFHVSILREDNIAMQILQLLIKHSDRWGRVDIDVDADAQVEVLEALQEVEGRLHALEKLRFCLQFNRFQPPSSGFMPLEGKRLEVRCFTKAPRLRHVELCLAPNYKFPGISTLDASVILPFHQLRTFVLCSLKGVSAAYKDLLSFSPNNLTTLIIDMQMDPTIQPQLTLPAVTFPNVVHLACRGSWYMGLPVLEPLTLPSLVTLKVQGGWMSNGFWYQSIINLIKRSKCQLRDVSFRWTEPNSTTLLLEILSLSPTITHLFLYNCDLPVLSALATGSVLPSLQYLKLYISLSIAMSPNPPELRTLVRIIESRSSMRDNLSEGIEPLREVSLRWPDSQGRLPGSLPMLEKALSDIANRGLHKPPPARAQAHVALLSEEVPKLLVAFDTYTKISPSDFDTRIERIRDRGVDSSPPTSAQEVAIDSILKKFELVNLAEPSSSIPFLRRGVPWQLYKLSQETRYTCHNGDVFKYDPCQFRYRLHVLLEKWRPFLIRDYKGLLFELVRTYDEAFTVKLVSDDSDELSSDIWEKITGRKEDRERTSQWLGDI